MKKKQIFNDVVRMMSEHNWLHNAINRNWIRPIEEEILNYFSNKIGLESKQGGTFEDKTGKVIGFYQTCKKGVTVEIPKEKYFYSWKAITAAVMETRFPNYQQLTFF